MLSMGCGSSAQQPEPQDTQPQQPPGAQQQQCLWLCGDPGSGKTFLGDYLATRGWQHIDGDQGNQSDDPDVKQRWAKLYQAMTTVQQASAQQLTPEQVAELIEACFLLDKDGDMNVELLANVFAEIQVPPPSAAAMQEIVDQVASSSGRVDFPELCELVGRHRAAVQPSSPVDEGLWRPYYDLLTEQYKTAITTGQNVVLSFALLDMFGEKSFLESEIPGIKFVIIQVSPDILLDRVLARNTVTLEKAGTTEAEVWNQDYMVEERKKYGEEYSADKFRQMMVDGSKNQTFVRKDESDQSLVTINNDDWKSFASIKELNQLVGIEWEEVDTKQIADVNMKRMENLNLEM